MKRIAGFLALGASFLILVLYTIMFWLAYRANGWQILGVLAYVSGMLATAAFLGLFVLLALRLHISPISPKVLTALKNALQRDEDPGVRSKAAVGLAELDMEESSHYYDHDDLDNALISALKDRDPSVRSKVAESLSELELEPFTHHEHNQLEDALLEDVARTFKQK